MTIYILVGYCNISREMIAQPFATQAAAEAECAERIAGTKPDHWRFTVVPAPL